jgi:hypothetical protein
MRVMARISGPTDRGNTAMTDGSNARLIQELLERWKPEAVYFATIDGQRGAYVVFDLQHPSDIPTFCEPLFQGLDAKVDIFPVMTPEDLQSAFATAQQ